MGRALGSTAWDVHREHRHQPGPRTAGVWPEFLLAWAKPTPKVPSAAAGEGARWQLQLLLQKTPVALWHHPLSSGSGRGFWSMLESLWGD